MINISGYPCDSVIQTKYSPLHQRQIQEQVMFLPGGGCGYYRARKGDACTFCAFPGFIKSTLDKHSKDKKYSSTKIEEHIYNEMFETLYSHVDSPDRITIFNGGSFFPRSEIPSRSKKYIYEKIRDINSVKELLIESYPNFITQRAIEFAKNNIGEKILNVAIGFESSNDYTRNHLLNKGISKLIFEEKVRLLKYNDIKVSVYTFLKSPGLSESQAINDVYETVKYLSELGVDEIVLSSAFVPQGTKLEKIYNTGNFRPPWLWSIIEIIKFATNLNIPLIVGGFDDIPPPIAGPSNCDFCNNHILSVIEDYRQSGKLDYANIPACNCERDWVEELSAPDILLKTF